MIYKPPGKGPFPAVIVLHTAGGIQDYLLDFADDLSDEGYVTLVVDYLSAPDGRGRDPDVVKEELRIIVEAYDQLKHSPRSIRIELAWSGSLGVQTEP